MTEFGFRHGHGKVNTLNIQPWNLIFAIPVRGLVSWVREPLKLKLFSGATDGIVTGCLVGRLVGGRIGLGIGAGFRCPGVIGCLVGRVVGRRVGLSTLVE